MRAITSTCPSPFHIDPSVIPQTMRWMGRLALPAVSWFTGLDRLEDCHQRACSMDSAMGFAERVLRSLDVVVNVDLKALERVPERGPLVAVANHPFGGIDGLAMLALLKRRRPDVKILANHLLKRIPELADDCIFVDPFGGPGATRRNVGPMRAARRWLKDGGALAVFPAGEVSSFSLRSRRVADIGWNPAIARLIRRAGAQVLPVFFDGQNSATLQLAGLVSPRLRTLLLPSEMLKRKGTRLDFEIGNVIASSRLEGFETDDGAARYLRARTYLLGGRSNDSVSPGAQSDVTGQLPSKLEHIAAPEDPDALEAEINELNPAERMLASSGRFRALFGSADELPVTLREIGRLRELTFRAVGEGTGRASDLDRFDQSYLHLFVWNDATRQVVGAYRLGLVDRIVNSDAGLDGLYTHTLFRYRRELLQQIGPSIELGRSFVRGEYQREFAPLMLLWKGIATFVARHPHYRSLFGPVSISNTYRSTTRQLLVEFLKANAASPELQRLVCPRNPPRFGTARSWAARLAATVVRSIEQVDELVGDIESERGGMPVLLRQYLKLNAKLLGFNVDPDFADTLDGLMLVKLTDVEPAILARYMGRAESERYLARAPVG